MLVGHNSSLSNVEFMLHRNFFFEKQLLFSNVKHFLWDSLSNVIVYTCEVYVYALKFIGGSSGCRLLLSKQGRGRFLIQVKSVKVKALMFDSRPNFDSVFLIESNRMILVLYIGL